MYELNNVLESTKKTFDLYSKAKYFFDNKQYQESLNLFGQVVFNLYSIKKDLNHNTIPDNVKNKLYPKIENSLKKSSDYIQELEIIDDEVSSEENNYEVNTNKSKKIIKDILLYSMEGDIMKIDEILKDNIDLNIKNLLGETPLHLAVKNGDTRMTELLLKNGSNINFVTNYGLTVMEIACVNKDFKMISLLQDYGCRLDKLINLRDNKNNSPGKLKSNKLDLILIVKKLLNIIQPLKISKTDSFFQIKESIINTKISNKKKIIILKVLDNIETSNTKIGWNEIQEDDIMQIIWNTIHSDNFINYKNDIINCLIEEIYYCKNVKNKENLYCPSTIYERIIYCLAGFNPEIIKINLDSVINYEILMYSKRLKDKILNKKNKNFLDIYNSTLYTEDQETKIDEFNIEFKKILINNLIEIYVDSGIMKKKELHMNLNKWINYI